MRMMIFQKAVPHFLYQIRRPETRPSVRQCIASASNFICLTCPACMTNKFWPANYVVTDIHACMHSPFLIVRTNAFPTNFMLTEETSPACGQLGVTSCELRLSSDAVACLPHVTKSAVPSLPCCVSRLLQDGTAGSNSWSGSATIEVQKGAQALQMVILDAAGSTLAAAEHPLAAVRAGDVERTEVPLRAVNGDAAGSVPVVWHLAGFCPRSLSLFCLPYLCWTIRAADVECANSLVLAVIATCIVTDGCMHGLVGAICDTSHGGPPQMLMFLFTTNGLPDSSYFRVEMPMHLRGWLIPVSCVR